MAESFEVPVIGVFFHDINYFPGWLESVELQRGDGVEPVPVIVVNHAPHDAAELPSCITAAIKSGRLLDANVYNQPENLGHTRAFNIGAERFRQCPEKWPWIASLDPDARLARRAIGEMISSGNNEEIGMVSPIIVAPRPDGDFQTPVDDKEIVSQAGHFPREPNDAGNPLKNYWRSHFRRKKVGDVREFLIKGTGSAPFTPCFCASLWSSRMFDSIDLPDPKQFRTLDCGEIGYRAQLNGWRGAFSSNAIAFHPHIKPEEYLARLVIENPGGTAWHYYHAQGLIALRYFPDHLRDQAGNQDGASRSWPDFFPDLRNINPDCDEKSRQETYERWKTYSTAS